MLIRAYAYFPLRSADGPGQCQRQCPGWCPSGLYRRHLDGAGIRIWRDAGSWRTSLLFSTAASPVGAIKISVDDPGYEPGGPISSKNPSRISSAGEALLIFLIRAKRCSWTVGVPCTRPTVLDKNRSISYTFLKIKRGSWHGCPLFSSVNLRQQQCRW